jgi:hypothetical protein
MDNRFDQTAKIIGLKLVSVHTNFYPFMQDTFVRLHTLLNCSAMHLFDSLISIYYYSAGYQYLDVEIKKNLSDIALVDPLILPLVSSSKIRFLSDGANLSRIDKTLNIANLLIAQEHLTVCPKSPKNFLNCSLCYKCQRTMMTLDAHGLLNKFFRVFHLGRWNKIRSNYIKKIKNIINPSVFIRDLINLGIITGYFDKYENINKR